MPPIRGPAPNTSLAIPSPERLNQLVPATLVVPLAMVVGVVSRNTVRVASIELRVFSDSAVTSVVVSLVHCFGSWSGHALALDRAHCEAGDKSITTSRTTCARAHIPPPARTHRSRARSHRCRPDALSPLLKSAVYTTVTTASSHSYRTTSVPSYSPAPITRALHSSVLR